LHQFNATSVLVVVSASVLISPAFAVDLI